MHERLPALGDGPAALAAAPAGVSGLKLAAGDVHLVEGGAQALGEHARAVGEHVEAAVVLQDAPVHAAPVALALVVGLQAERWDGRFRHERTSYKGRRQSGRTSSCTKNEWRVEPRFMG